MTGGFSNPIVGGGGALVYPAIHSPNYVLGVTGWAIRKDGTAQFTGLVLIGGTFTGINFIINSSGSFFYSGAPAAGNLIQSIAAAAGTDAQGNAYLAGDTTYTTILGHGVFAVGIVNGQITYYQAATEAGPYTSKAVISIASGALAGIPAGTLVITDGTDLFMYSPQVFIGTGSATPVTTAQLEVDGTIAANLIEAIISGAAETWHNLVLVNGWTGTARYRLLPDGRVELDINLSSAAATAFQFSTMPSGYIPANTEYLAAGATANVSSSVAPFIQVVGSTGAISMNGLHAFSTAGSWVAGGSYPLN